MTTRAFSLLAGLVLSAALCSLAALAEDRSGEFLVSSVSGWGYLPTAAMDQRGEVLVVWGGGLFGVTGRRFDRLGNPRSDDFEVGGQGGDYLERPSAAVDSKGFTVSWGASNNHSAGTASVRRFDFAGRPLIDQRFLDGFSPRVGASLAGNAVLVNGFQGGIFGQRMDAAGNPVGPQFHVSGNGSPAFSPQVTVDGTGGFVVVWASLDGIFGRRFDALAQRRGPGFRVAQAAAPPALAGNAKGSFVVAWTQEKAVRARLYGPGGHPLGGPILVATSLHEFPQVSVAMDAAGRFLVAWCCGPPAPAKISGRFFEASGAPLERELRISLPSPDADSDPAAAAGPAGDFLVVWPRTFASVGGALVGRRLTWGRSGADPCLYGAAGLVCDLARTGGPPAVAAPVLAGPGIPLFGDLDDDGRDDPCLFRNGRFLCDTAHDGGAAELEADLGGPGDLPLIGDLDGEGRDDACVRRGGQVLCDTAHNGGTAEVVVTFGAAGDVILLGDVDGDGADDPCAVAGGALRCDTEHDGGRPEVEIPFALRPGDVPLLGDADADGRDDPCLFRGGRFLCDVFHTGSLRPFGAAFAAAPGAVPLLGDLNGI